MPDVSARAAATLLRPPAPTANATGPARLLDHLAIGVLACAADGRGTFVSAPARALLALAPELSDADAFARALARLTMPGGASLADDDTVVRRALRGEPADDVTLRIVDGATVRPVVARVRPITDAEGRVEGAVLTLDDDAADRRVAAASELLSRTGHELRTPITAIRGALDLLLGDGSAVPPARRGLVDIVRRNVASLLHVVNDLLDVERLETGREVLQREEMDVAALAALAVDAVRPQADEANVTVDVQVPALRAHADAARIRQVLATLLGLAVARSAPGTRVTVEARPDGPRVRILVRDAGVAIPPDRIDRAFERFEAPLPGARTRAVTGLGLALCRAIVEYHGGTIGIASAPGSGATFAFTVPATA